MHPNDGFGVLDLRGRNVQTKREHLLGTREPGIDVAQRLERPDHQTGADEQHQRERHLDDDERAARAMSIAARARRTAAAVQSGRDVSAGVLHDRNRAEQQTCDDGHRERGQENRRVDRNIVETRQIACTILKSLAMECDGLQSEAVEPSKFLPHSNHKHQ